MRRRPFVGALVFAGLVAVVLIASVLGSAPASHRPGPLELTIQLLVLVVAALLVAGRVRRRR